MISIYNNKIRELSLEIFPGQYFAPRKQGTTPKFR
jgi:hypothetical protein